MPALIKLSPLEFVREVADGTVCKPTHAVVPIVEEAAPSYDSATEKLVRNRTVSQDQVTNGFSVVNLSAAEIAKNELESGYLVSPENYRLSATKNSRTNFTTLVTLLNQLLAAQQITTQTNQTILDIQGNPQTIATGRLLEVMASYGVWCLSRVMTSGDL